jgi:hypothetical protein
MVDLDDYAMAALVARTSSDRTPLARALQDARPARHALMRSHCAVKIAFGIIPWMPLVPSTTWVT